MNLGPPFQPGGAFYVPTDGGAYLNQSSSVGTAGLQLDYALLDFARTPRVQAARAALERERQIYGNQLRLLQLSISEAYYQLQQADQNVRIQDAAVRDDLLILQDSLDLKLAGLVPRVDVLRRRAIEASDQEALIQALADRAIARRRLALVLNLPATVTPSASDPIAVMPQWPLNLEQSLLAAYRGNPELEAILATRTALFAGGGSYGQNVTSSTSQPAAGAVVDPPSSPPSTPVATTGPSVSASAGCSLTRAPRAAKPGPCNGAWKRWSGSGCVCR